jgi:beta-lactamase class A
MNVHASGLTSLLEAEAARFTLQRPDDAAPAGALEFEALREHKPLGVGIYVKHLTTGEEAAVRPDVTFEAQSVIKLPLAIRSYQLADQGRLDLDERVPLAGSDSAVGSGILQFLQPGLAPTWRDLLTLLIIVSDNTADGLLLKRIGGITGFNAWLAAAGYSQTRLGQLGWESFRNTYLLADARHSSLTRTQVYALQTGDQPAAGMTRERFDSIRRDVDALAARPLGEVRALAIERGFPLFYSGMTPREAGHMLESVERATSVSANSSAELRHSLRQQQMGERRLPRFAGHPVGHKTGDSPPWDANDVGIVYSRGGPIVIAVFANDLDGDYEEEEDRIGQIGRVVINYFERAH